MKQIDCGTSCLPGFKILSSLKLNSLKIITTKLDAETQEGPIKKIEDATNKHLPWFEIGHLQSLQRPHFCTSPSALNPNPNLPDLLATAIFQICP